MKELESPFKFLCRLFRRDRSLDQAMWLQRELDALREARELGR